MSNELDTRIPEDPFRGLGLVGFGLAFRAGRLSAEEATRAYLARISVLDPVVGAFEEICELAALETARSMDRLISNGHDLGPLMGVPIAIKDIFAVSGTQTRAGSRMRVDDLVGPEGSFVQSLRRAGCIILGKTKTTEFAFCPSGINEVAGTPRNPWDPNTFRIAGGSSSGSAAALAAGLCALSVGSDTGGSVRVPAALNGLVGLKTSVGLWNTDGVFSLSTTFDSIGLFVGTVADAALAFAAIENREVPRSRTVEGLRLGVPRQYFLDGLEPEVSQAFDAATSKLEEQGARLVPIDLPEASERIQIIGQILASELIASVGRDRIISALPAMDPFVRLRVEAGAQISATQYITMKRRHQVIEREIARRLAHLDGWISPTVPCVAPEREACGGADEQARMNLRLTQNTQPGNLFGQCGVSLPLSAAGFPAGLQLMANNGADAEIIEVAAAIESVVGPGSRCDPSGFLAASRA